MNSLTRRSFLKGSVVAGVAAAAPYAMAHSKPGSRVLGANDEVSVAVVGIRSKGAQHIRIFHDLPNVRVRAICDVDQAILDREVQKFTDRGRKSKGLYGRSQITRQ